MTGEEASRRLARKGVKATANRILVYKALAECGRPLALADLEARLLSIDRSSIFRALALFAGHDVVHGFEDGRGVMHYELCGSNGACDHADGHLHFYCESCHQSFCLEHIPLPDIDLPQGFRPHAVSFVIKGECPECAAMGR